MSQENVEIVRRLWDAASRRDVEAVLVLYDPEVEFDVSRHPLTSLIGGRRVYRGHEGLRSFFRERSEALENVEDVYEELIDAGDHVVAVAHVRGRGRGSGVEVELPHAAAVLTIREGKVVRVVFLPTRDEALEAAGLGEKAISEENVEVVRRHHERYGDLAPKDTSQFVAEFWDSDGDYYPVRKFPEARPCHGREEIARFHAEYLAAWDRFEFAIKNLIAVGDDRVFVHATWRAEGRESGVKLDADLYHCVWLRQGRILRWEDHLTLRRAVRALGLSGETLEAAGLSG
jgi:ketosteroid isomerase-like protein